MKWISHFAIVVVLISHPLAEAGQASAELIACIKTLVSDLKSDLELEEWEEIDYEAKIKIQLNDNFEIASVELTEPTNIEDLNKAILEGLRASGPFSYLTGLNPEEQVLARELTLRISPSK